MTTKLPSGTGGVRARRIAILLPNLDAGGAQRVTVTLADGFVEEGLQVDLLVARSGRNAATVIPARARILNLEARGTAAAFPKLVRYLHSVRPAAVLSAMDHTNVVALASAQVAGFRQPRIAVSHTIARRAARDDATARAAVVRKVLPRVYSLATDVVAVSRSVARELVQIGVDPRKISVIPNPVISPELSSAARNGPVHEWLRDPRSTPVLTAAGRLHPVKGFDVLIRALREVPGVRLIILGDGAERPALERLTADLSLGDRVALPGWAENPYGMIAASDLFVLSSRSEGLPTALIEAIALGTPAVATDCTGVADVAEAAPTRLLTTAIGDPLALAAAIQRALGSLEPGKATTLPMFETTNVVHTYLSLMGLVDE